ncbi:PRC-barrel domain containing protein [Sphingomonas paeninsulae]|uniref:PRC-barrel domain containing protein n=1 Tax=Sphingomonas paeninsulae TaxID=2319844 RepID=A0A494TD52_SPHPE|nr:PRC-barrel domain-containing protein [Sphingomonas paeninsulae]AYJ87429.1 PRC-barrel domain containing protein [Sphingomonas paeninsulae]
MENVAGWIALVATCSAALMTASNLGARVTGWGFVIFTVGAVAWTTVAVLSGQTQLLWSNAFLMLVDLLGIWRWLGHQARVEDTAKAAIAISKRETSATLFSATALGGMPVIGKDGNRLALAVEAMAACESGQLEYLIISAGGVGGLGETLHQLPWTQARIVHDTVETDLDPDALSLLPLAKAAAA